METTKQPIRVGYKEVNWDLWTPRAHMVGLLMTNPKGKSNKEKYEAAHDTFNAKIAEIATKKDTTTAVYKKLLDAIEKAKNEIQRLEPIQDELHLSQSCKTALANIFTFETTGREEKIESKYMTKGLEVEQDIITLYSVVKFKYYRKNHVRLNNGWVEGEIDFRDDELDQVIDAKASYEVYTFNRTKAKKMLPIYEWQGRAYMWLENKSRFKLLYGLIDTPEHLIRREENKIRNFVTNEEDYEEAKKDIRFLHTYADIPNHEKIFERDITRDEQLEKEMEVRILQCREYLKNFGKKNLISDGYNDSDDSAVDG